MILTEAGSTPPLHTSQIALLGWKGKNEVAKDILQGKQELLKTAPFNKKNGSFSHHSNGGSTVRYNQRVALRRGI
jgi:hypothetical protein